MSNFSAFLTPVAVDSEDYSKDQFGNQLAINYEGKEFDFEAKYDIALVFIPENRGVNSEVKPISKEFRTYFYNLFVPQTKVKVADLGDIMPGNKLSDTYYAEQELIKELIKKGTLPIIIGGSRDNIYGNFLAYKDLDQTVNITSIDSSIGIGNADKEISADNYLSKIILHQPNYLFNFSNIGYQSYLVSQEELNLIEELYFDACRLGVARSSLRDTEPIIRNADLLSFDLSAIRQSDASGSTSPSPNGFAGEEACQLCRYAGMSDKLTSIGFYGANALNDFNAQTAHLLAQMIWYFIEGYYSRKGDFPTTNKNAYTKYLVNIDDCEETLVFYKSTKSERWWMDVPYPNLAKAKFEQHFFVPCSYEDYQTACKNEMPERWIQTIQKLK